MDTDTVRWLNAFFELIVVLAFALGWLILELNGRRLDREREKRRANETDASPSASKPAEQDRSERTPRHPER